MEKHMPSQMEEKKMGCVDMPRGLCPRCMGKGKKAAEKFMGYWVDTRTEEWDSHGSFLNVLNVALSGYGIETSRA